jgi:hypothetical protein
MTTTELKNCIRDGKYAWPGGYPKYFITSDGEALSFDAVKDNFHDVVFNMKYLPSFHGWNVVACAINWEDDNLTCSHTDEKIESAYGE